MKVKHEKQRKKLINNAPKRFPLTKTRIVRQDFTILLENKENPNL